jgi:hypothetical protein
MAVSGLACTGGTGEDYAVPGWNALVLQTTDPQEFMGLFLPLQSHPTELRAMRRRGRLTANQQTWEAIIKRSLWPRLAAEGKSDEKRPAEGSDELFRSCPRGMSPTPPLQSEAVLAPAT